MKKLIVICGPTAVGKTALALALAKKFGGQIVAADSRQVYQGMDIGTGKDVPTGSAWHPHPMLSGYWQTQEGVVMWGYDIADPRKSFSVSHFVQWGRQVLEHIWSQGRVAIIVGGSGLYVKALVDGIDTLLISPNAPLRQKLEDKSAQELFEILSTVDPFRAGGMNDSDRKNPRRLLRAIEVGLSQKDINAKKIEPLDARAVWIGLQTDRALLKETIEKRVQDRLLAGFESEVARLLELGSDVYGQAMSSFGYREISAYLQGELKHDEAISAWIQAEQKYVKKQLVWFKKEKRIIWFDITKDSFEKDINALIAKQLKLL